MNKIIKNILLLASITSIIGCGSETSYTAATQTNIAPVANAGEDNHFVLDYSVDLNGTLSEDEDGDSLNYSWHIVSKPSGSVATLEDSTTSTPSFIADKEGDYTIELIVNDGQADSLADSVTIKPMENVDPNDFIAPTL